MGQREDTANPGRSGKLIASSYARKFKEAIKGAKLVSIPEAGHMVQMEKTAQVVEAVKRSGEGVRV